MLYAKKTEIFFIEKQNELERNIDVLEFAVDTVISDKKDFLVSDPISDEIEIFIST